MDRVSQEKWQAAVAAIPLASLFLVLVRICRLIGVILALVGAAVPEEASLGTAGRGVATDIKPPVPGGKGRPRWACRGRLTLDSFDSWDTSNAR